MVADLETPPEMVADPSCCSSTETVETFTAYQRQQSCCSRCLAHTLQIACQTKQFKKNLRNIYSDFAPGQVLTL